MSTCRRPAPAAAPPPGRCYAAVSLSGRLCLLHAPADATTRAALGRRTATGTVYRIDLDGGITAWLDGDHQDGSGELNWAATQICAALSGDAFTDPWDAPFVCGPVLFTGTDPAGTNTTHPLGLCDAQLAHIIAAHAAAQDTELQNLQDAAELQDIGELAQEWAR